MSSLNELPSFTLPPFANKLIQSGYINLPQMQQALLEKQKSGDSLLDIIQKVTGRPLPPDFVREYRQEYLFSLKLLHGIDVFDPDSYTFDWQEVKELVQTLVPLEVCRQHQLFPLKKRNQQPPSIVVAMVDPRDPQAINALKEILTPPKIKLARKAIAEQDFKQLIEKYIREQHPQDATLVGEPELETLVGIPDIFGGAPAYLGASRQKTEYDLNLISEGEENPVIVLVNNMLVQALENKASEIQIEPQASHLSVSFRQDGILSPAFAPIPKEIAPAVISRFKLLAKLNHRQLNTPQKGRMQKSFGGRQIDFWVSILPGHNGEKVVLRILDPKAVSLDLEELVINKDTRELIKNLLSRSTGLLLTTGPEVSGISTTLAALLTQRNQLGVNIATVEDPIERTLPGINQVEVSEDMGRDYDSVLHSFLNQNIDVIGVDQIRGRKTAKAIVSAALNHLVLTSFSAPDAASAIVRLTKLGVDVASLANNLIGIINQRLVRRLCPACRLSYEPTAPELEKLGLSSLAKSKISCYRAKVLTPQEIEKYRSKGRLCRQCNGTGYQGQIGIYEVMGISQRIKTLIGQEEEVQTIYQAAIEEGMQSLLAYGVELVLEGKTTFAELEQVLEDYVHLQSTGAQQPYQGGVSPQLLSRVQAMEKLLNQLNQEFKQLKKEIELAINEPYEGDNVEVYEELKQSREWQEIKQELDLNRDTIVSNVPVYEELIDPGEWEELQKELDPDKETIVSQDEDLLNLELDPSFRPLSDPWS